MVGDYPKLRDDLSITQLADADEPTYVVKDPVTRRFFRLKRAEYFIASHLDGKSSLDSIGRQFEAEFEMSISTTKLERYVGRLRRLGILEDGFTGGEDAKPAERVKDEKSYVQRVLYLKVKTVDPDRLFDSIVSRAGFFFTKTFVVIATAFITVAVVIIASNWSEYAEQLQRLVKPSMIPVILLVVLTVTALHESAHGLTCKRFGGEVHEMGFLLIYLLPAFYCNVSDAWLFPDRRKRLWVSFAGVFFQVFVWAVAVVVWRLIDTETWLSDLCCIFMATTGISTAFNLAPLLKLDGYYMLSDYLGMPNLRKNAFDYVRGTIKGWFRPASRTRLVVTSRERRAFLLYGVFAGLYSIGLLVFIVFKITAFVFSRFHGTGVILLYGAILLVVTGSIDRAVSGLRSAMTTRKGLNVIRKRTVGLFLAAAAVVLIPIFGRWELKISSKSQVFAASRAQIRVQVDGTIREIYVDEGDSVAANELIAQLDDTEFRSEMMKIAAELAKRNAELSLLEKGPLDEEVKRLEGLVEREKTKVVFAEKEFQRISELRQKNVVSSAEYEHAKEQLDLCRKDLEHAQSDLDVLLTGNRPEQIEAARAEMKRLEVMHQFLAEQLEKTKIVSPIPGIVSTHHLEDRLGEHLEMGDELCRIVNYRTMLLEIPVSEKDVAYVRVGQRVKFRARSIPELAFHGRVTEIAPSASRQNNRTVFVVTSEVDNGNLILRPGMTGNAKIYCGKRSIIYLWTRHIIKFIRVEFWW